MTKISGGYYIKARRIQESEIQRHPPYVREIWDWLLMNANHSDARYNGNTVKRGQLFRSYKDIREGLCWYVGYRKEMYSENQTKKAMKSLREAGMIATAKAPGGVLITISNYNKYQNPENYESTSERTIERTNAEPMLNQGGPSNNKKKKNGRMEEEKNTMSGSKPNGVPFKEIIFFLNEKSGKDFKPGTKATQQHIRARWNEGFRVPDFETVISSKVDEWKNEPEMMQYIRPQTLFGTKFESYLQAAKETPERKSRWNKNGQ